MFHAYIGEVEPQIPRRSLIGLQHCDVELNTPCGQRNVPRKFGAYCIS